MGFLPIIMRLGAKPHLLTVMLTIDCEDHNLHLSQSRLYTPLRPSHGSLAIAVFISIIINTFLVIKLSSQIKG